jgi:broad specificity phosphatase PhoE
MRRREIGQPARTLRRGAVPGLATGGRAGAAVLLLLAASTALTSPAPVSAQTPSQTTVIVVRHAERADDGSTRDPELSEVGRRSAERLAEALAHTGIEGVIVTQYQRTAMTAAPLVDRHRLPVERVEAVSGGTEAHVQAIVDAIRERHLGRAVLVVGHSNTVPLIVRALSGRGAEEVPDMPDSEYGTIYVVTIAADVPPIPGTRPARLIRARF